MFAFIGLIVIISGRNTVKLNDYVTVDFSGYNQYGTATCSFDFDGFEADYGKKIKLKNRRGRTMASELAADYLIEECVGLSLENNSGLSNGDTVTVKWDCDDETAKEYFGVKLKYSDIEIEAEGLKEAKSLNPFDYITVAFSGTSPYGKATVSKNFENGVGDCLRFTLSKYDNLKAGEKITVTVSTSYDMNYFAEQYGMVLSATEKEYTVAGLSEYVTSVDEISKDMYDKMDKQLRDKLKADYANWEKDKLVKMELIGNYCVTVKPGMTFSCYNYIYFVYKITSYNSDLGGNFTYYWYGAFENVLILADGTCTVDLSTYTTPRTGWFSDETVPICDGQIIYGYADLDSLFNRQIVTKIEKYDYTSTVKES